MRLCCGCACRRASWSAPSCCCPARASRAGRSSRSGGRSSTATPKRAPRRMDGRSRACSRCSTQLGRARSRSRLRAAPIAEARARLTGELTDTTAEDPSAPPNRSRAAPRAASRRRRLVKPAAPEAARRHGDGHAGVDRRGARSRRPRRRPWLRRSRSGRRASEMVLEPLGVPRAGRARRLRQPRRRQPQPAPSALPHAFRHSAPPGPATVRARFRAGALRMSSSPRAAADPGLRRSASSSGRRRAPGEAARREAAGGPPQLAAPLAAPAPEAPLTGPTGAAHSFTRF